MGYKTTETFLKMFGISSLKELPELPKLKEELDQVEMDTGDAQVDDNNQESQSN